jgi:hypothetical protein
MCASLIDVIRAGPPPPKVVLLPDGMFFNRSLPIAPGATAAEVTGQVELALEALSPFPLTQLYYGYFWQPGNERAFVFAAYRRRFTTEQTETWKGAALVLPTFAAVFGAEVAPATTIVLSAPDGLTAVHWTSSAGPAQVWFRPLAAEATDEDRARIREELLRAVGGSKTVIDLPAAPMAEPAKSDDEIVFTSGPVVSRLPATLFAALDVRDKDQLASLRQAKMYDLLAWRTALGFAAVLVLLAVGELLVLGGNKLWQKARITQLNAQRPTVEKILTAQTFAMRIEERATKRLLPFEMITIVSEKKPASIQFTRTMTTGIDTLVVDAQTNNAGDIGVYENALKSLPTCENVEVRIQPSSGDAIFTVVVTFKPGAVEAAVL